MRMVSVIPQDMLQNLCREVAGQEVGGDHLVVHGFPEKGVVDVVDHAYGC